MGPFDSPQHENFTWSPHRTQPKEQGRRVILDLSFGEYSVNNVTCTSQVNRHGFMLKLPI